MSEARCIHVELLEDLALELGIEPELLLTACDEKAAQAIECDWEDEWPTREPRRRHGWRNNEVADALGLDSERLHTFCKELGIMFVQAGDRRAGSSAFFRGSV